jgi:hypothetical protein
MILKSLPKNLLIVFIFAGDSTISSFFITLSLYTLFLFPLAAHPELGRRVTLLPGYA